MLGICRGLQVLNVWGGGTLHQHVPAHARYDAAADARVDDVVIEPGTVLHDLYGPTLAVNSLHHQTVDRVADGWAGGRPQQRRAATSRRWSGRGTT